MIAHDRDGFVDWLGLSGRVCVVTGGGGGIGRATAVSLATRAPVWPRSIATNAGLKDEAELRKLGVAISSRDVTPRRRERDIGVRDDRESLGPCGVLVNTAAVLRPGGLDTLSLAEWNAVLAVNLTGYFLCAQTSAGRCANSGAAAWFTWPRSPAAMRKRRAAPAASAQAGVVMLSRQLASEWGRMASAAMSSARAWSSRR